MHGSVRRYVGSMRLGHRENVLEVGSLNVNGGVRDLIDAGSYVGLDMRPGPDVDVVGLAKELPFGDATFDLVVCTEMLEHDPTFWLSLAEMGRVLKPKALLILTTRGNGFAEHRHPVDHYRFMPDSMPVLLDLASCNPIDMRLDPEAEGIFMLGQRR